MEIFLRPVVTEEAGETVAVKNDPQKNVLCSPCNLWFGDVLSFIRHHLQHEIQREVPCLLCKQSFITKPHLLDHYGNFHNIEAVAAPPAPPQSGDRDLTTHVDHSYFRAENGEQGETDVRVHNVVEEEGILKDGGSLGEETTEIDGEGEEKTDIAGEGDKKAEIAGEGEEKTDIAGEGDEKAEIAGEGEENSEIVGEGDEKTELAGEGDKKTEIAGEEEEKTEIVGEGDEMAEIVGGGEEKTEIVGEGEEKIEIVGEGDEMAEIVGEGEEKPETVRGREDMTEMVVGAEDILKDTIIGNEPMIQQTSIEHDPYTEECLKPLAEIEDEKVMEVESCDAELAAMDSNNKEENEGELEEGGSKSPCREEDEMSNSVGSGDHTEVAPQEEMDVEEEVGQMGELTENAFDARTSPFDEMQGGRNTLDSIHSDQLDDDSHTFMERIHLETGDSFEGSFSDDKDEHGLETAHSEENTDEMDPEYEDGDFRFISGLRHRQIHIANTNLVTDIGTQVFICLHCDFIDSEAGLVNHMKKTHEQVMELESTMLHYQRVVPADRVFPESITGEEVMRLSEYHRRNLEQKHLSSRSGKRTARTDGVRVKRHLVCVNEGGTSEKKKRYVENRMPCLCPECGKILCRKSALRTHILGVHSRSRNHLCEVCGKAFRAAYHLSQHRKSHRTKTFSCDLCDFTSDVRMDIFDHQQMHPNKFILCHVCGTVLKSKTALTRHMMVHSESRPFACTVEGCTWRFTSEALCKGHIESHNSPGEFICLECKRRFRKRHHIRRHLKTVHGKVSNSDADKFVAVDAKVVPSTQQFGQIPVTQLSKQHIVITTDEHGTPIFCDQNDELVFDSKTSSLLQVTVKHSDGI